jgi:molybdate transport system substrate-binding protein
MDWNFKKKGKMFKLLALIMLMALVILTFTGCSSQAEPVSGDVTNNQNQNLSLFVAAGMKKPMDAVIEKFQKENGAKVTPNYGPSGGLWAQIREGQPCDLYYSADWIYIEKAQSEDKLTEAKGFLNDNLVLVVSESGAEEIKSLQDLDKSDVTFAIGDPQAPVGAYAEKALRNLELWDKLQDNLKAMPSTVNQVAIMVKEDQVDAGLIYSSVANGNGLKIVETIDQEYTGEIVFGVGIVKGGNEKLAKEFMDFAFENVNEFSKYGWTPYE